MRHAFRSSWTRLAAIALLASAGCAVASSTSPYFGEVRPPDGQVLRYISGSEPESLDPHISTGQPEARIQYGLFDGLTEAHPETSEPIPSMAERWESLHSNTEFVFHLRDGLQWSNGRPITAEDFVYSLRRGLSPGLAARAAYMAYDIEYAQAYNEGGLFVRDRRTGAFLADPASPTHRLVLPGDERARADALKAPALAAAVGQELVPVTAEDIGVEAVDARTLRFRLARAIPFLAGLVAHQFFRPVPREAVERFGDAWTRPEHIVTSGAFTLDTWKPYDRIILVRNPRYWDAGRVRLDRITFYPLEDATTMMNLYKAGEVDAVYNHVPPAAWIDSLRGKKDYMDEPEVTIEYYMFNTTRPPMNDVRVRKALNMAIDKAALAAYRRTAKPLTGFVPAAIFPGYPAPEGDPFDPERARRLLAEAGYRTPSGEYDSSRFPIGEVELTYNTSESNRQTAEFVQAQWKQNLGLTVPIKNMEWKTFLSTRAALEYEGVSRAGWVGDYMDPYTFLALFSTVGGDNGTGWFDPRYAAMLVRANGEPDPHERYRQLAEAEKRLLDVQPVIPLTTPATNWMKKPYVKGMFANPQTLHAWKFVYIEHDASKWDDPVTIVP
ncbi:MAG: peptide ABC transporter substrate-binding protein [Acidobacteria bacterium]|nr:peptide ABC transporter substrate-binding protein [Acidobacteriota bacterium]